MAKKPTAEPENLDVRDRPVRTMIALVVGFLLIVGIATWTVLLPELADDAGEEDEGRAGQEPEPPPPMPAAPPPT